MRLLELQCKDVINVENGCRIGYVCDIDIDPQLAKICAIIVERRSVINYLKFLKEPNVIVIPIENIVSIGKDVILVNIFC